MIGVIRYGIGVVMVIGGIVMIILNPGGFGVDGFAMAVGGGLSVLLINYLFRLGVTGDEERRREEEARRFLDEHGYWPDEAAADAARTDRGSKPAVQHRLGSAISRRRVPPAIPDRQPRRRR